MNAVLETPDDKMELRVQERNVEPQQSSEALLHAKELLEVTLNCIGDAVIATDVDGKITFLNPIAERLTGWTASEASGVPIASVFRIFIEQSRQPAEEPVMRCMRDRQVGGLAQETLLIRRNGDEISIDDTAAPIFDHNQKMVGAVLIFRDVTEKRRLARQLTHQADHDSLTGLTNRREFGRRLKIVLEEPGRNDLHSLLYIDVDQFKVVNDTSGHLAGDALLCQISTILQSRIETSKAVSCVG